MSTGLIDDAGSGLQLVQTAFAKGGFGRGIGKTLGFKGLFAESGRVDLAGNPTEEHYNPLGSVHGGYLSTLVDGAMALAVQTQLPAGTPYATTDLRVTFLRAVTVKSGQLCAHGSVVHMSRSLAVAEARLVAADDELCAHATATFRIKRP